MDISDINHVKGRMELATFLGALAEDFRGCGGEWKNKTIDEFLEACAAEVANSPKIGANWDSASYKTLAQIFFMGKVR